MADDDRDKILKRREYFVRAALASMSAGVLLASCKESPPQPQPCLTPVSPSTSPKPCLKMALPPDAGSEAPDASENSPGNSDASIDAAPPDASSKPTSSAAPTNTTRPRPPPQPCLSPPRPQPCLKMKPPSGGDRNPL